MNMLELLNPYRWLLYPALVGALLLGAWRLDVSRQQIGYDKAKAECMAAADKANQLAQVQRDAQAVNAAAASAGYENARSAWEKTLKVTKHDLYAATQNLATCKLTGDSVRLLNDAGDGNTASP